MRIKGLLPQTARAFAAASAILCAAAGFAGEGKPGPLTLCDFEHPDAVKLSAYQAEFRLIASEGGNALRISTEAEAPSPSVTIEAKSGRWDLRGYDAVSLEVINPEDTPLNAVLCINNPGADGRKLCNKEAAVVPARGRAVITLFFGMWHGEPGHPLDLEDIVSASILLDRPGRPRSFTVNGLKAIRVRRAGLDELSKKPFFGRMKPVFGRGVNLGNALEAPNEGDWGVTLKEEYFDLIKEAGFQSVRIPARWSAHADKSAPYAIDGNFLLRVDWAVKKALYRGLEAVLNIHHYEEIVKQPDAHRERFLALWKQIAAHFKDFPASLAFELLNEPNDELSAEKWNKMAAEAVAVIRKTNPTRMIVVGPVGWNSAKELPSLEVPDDKNLVVTFHYYDPFKFTHQGASWTGEESKKWLGTKWSGTPEERLAVEKDLDAALAWAIEHQRSIYMGEFGAYDKADLESRARWTAFVAKEALRRKIGFAYWEFCAGFGCYDAKNGRWVAPLKDALLKECKGGVTMPPVDGK